MSTDKEILFPDQEIEIGDGKVTVREMTWKNHLDFLGELGGFLKTVQNEKGEVRLDIGIIVDVISGARELTESLIAKATDKDAEWYGKQRLSDVLKVIEAAIELNLRVLKESGKRLAGRLKESGVGRTAPPATARSEAPTPSS